ncbi:MAG TPA: hypothetical protein VFV19_17335 [Candidatus Polarisedimenticolaceae bacterium]|nr:hypothetical protein [Candidatus Polarisedimenticolaceae bacterium]
MKKIDTANGPIWVGDPVVPIVTPAVRDLPDYTPDPNAFGLEMKRREDYGFLPIPYPIKPTVDPLFYQQQRESLTGPGRQVDAFSSPLLNFAGQTSSASPPDTVGDVGPNHYVQAVNQSVSTVQVLSKVNGANLKTFTMQSLTTATPCRTGFCDPVVLYDRAADRWLISELPSSGGNVCVYVSQTPDPTGAWYAYTFAVETSTTDYPKYGVWPQNGNGGSYLLGVNAGSGGRDVIALDRAKMLAGLPATFQKKTVPSLPNSGFQLVLPGTMQGPTPPPNGAPAIFMRPRDDEAQDGATTPYDLLEMWALAVDWATPGNTTLTKLTSIQIGDYDMSLCGLGNTWNCMPQAGTTQRIDPIREPLHFPLQYRNFGDHETLVGTFPEDVDGTDHAALRWFELRKSGAGAWSLYQEGLVGGEAGVHRSVGSIAMDQSGNIAMGYTRTGDSLFPSIYYTGRLAGDPLGTMPQGENAIQVASTSKTNNERWGDYSGIGIDPADDCTFWYTSEYGGSGATRVAAFKFDACGCLAVPPSPSASAVAPQDNRIDVSWNDSAAASIVQYQVFRATTSGGPYTQIASVPDSSPGTANGAPYTYHDDTVSGGTRYYYVVKSNDGGACFSQASAEVNALATGACILAPSFAGVTSAGNPGTATCTVNLTWAAATTTCGGGVSYNVYRSTTSGFTPSPSNRIATGLSTLAFSDGVGLTGGTAYFYVVRAVDGVNALEETNTVQRAAAPTGPPTLTSWTDTFEGAQSGGGFDQAGWTHAPVNGTFNWLWSMARFHDGTHSWFAQDNSSSNDKVLVSPTFTVVAGTTLSFWHTYAFEYSASTCWDGGTLEYTLNGTTWTVMPDADFTAGGFTGTTSTNNIMGAKRAWCQGTIGALTQVSLNLGGDANLLNKTIQVRWHEGDDTSTGGSGWYVDTVSLGNIQTGGACTTGSGTLTLGNDGPICEHGTLHLTSSYSQAGTTYSWTGPNGFTSSQQNPTIVNASAAANGTYTVTVFSGASAVASSQTPATVTADGGACNDGNACTTGDACGAGTCQPGTPISCDDLNPCTDDNCDTLTGCAHANNTAACDDGNACTAGDICGGGACLPGAPVPPPAAVSGVAFSSGSGLAWAPIPGASTYDVVRGTLSSLRVSGDFSSALDACVANDLAATTLDDPHVPAQDDGDWYLVRASACGTGTYDDGSAQQAAPRDAAIAASANTCP